MMCQFVISDFLIIHFLIFINNSLNIHKYENNDFYLKRKYDKFLQRIN